MKDNIYKRIVDTWGVESQFNMCIEEVGELLQAISKYRRSQFTNDKEKIEKSYIHLCEEIADVENMINQLRYIFDSKLIDDFKENKLKRISKILDNYEKNISK